MTYKYKQKIRTKQCKCCRMLISFKHENGKTYPCNADNGLRHFCNYPNPGIKQQ